jgi:hypothetical protein
MRYVTPLTAEEAVPAEDMVPVYHPAGGQNVNRALSLETMKTVLGGGGATPPAGVSKTEFEAFKAAVIADLNNLRDSIALMASSLDDDAGVATTTYAATCTPPPITAALTGRK